MNEYGEVITTYAKVLLVEEEEGDRLINLPLKSINLLKKFLENNKIELLWVINDNNMIEVDESLGNDLREAVCDELIKNGLKDNNPTEYGLELENLIDEIGRLFM